MKNKIKWFLHVTFRHFILGLRIRFLNKFYGMNISPTARISLKSKLDKTNPKGVIVGEYSYLAFGSVILAHDMSRNLSSSVTIGQKCFIGANAILMPGVELGDSVIVGAGSVVTKSFPSNVIISGNPAKIIKSGIKTGNLGILIREAK
jgi:acetyltransferase-like isoleucine patch superfamily enzyme